jgi:transcriptional regulator with XRE-family HTH domain
LENYTPFGMQARAIMLKNGITVQSLAEQIGISTPYLSDILRGGRKGKKYLGKIADALGIEYLQ